MKNEAKATMQLAVPIIFGELAQMGLHIIDTAMVGALGYRELAATALVMNAMNIPFVLGIGMTISVSQMVSLSNGRKDAGAVSHYLFNGFILCSVTALFISLCLVFGRNLLGYLGQDKEVVELALPLMTLMGLSIIPMLLFMTLKQFADGLEFTRTAMLLSLIALPINAFLNWLLIYGNWSFPSLGLIGAGWATLITRTLIFVALGAIILKHKTFAQYISLGKVHWTLKTKTIRELLYIGVPSSLQIGMEAGVFAVSGIIIGTISAVAQAAHQIALTCAAFTFMFSMGLAQAGSIRVSNAYGQGKWTKILLIGKSTLVIALIYGTLCALGFVVLRSALPTLFNTHEGVISLASTLLLFAAVFQISDSTQAIGAGLLRGIKDVKAPTILIGIAYWVLGLPLGLLLAFKFGLGAGGMWTGLIIGLTFASLSLIYRFLSKAKGTANSKPMMHQAERAGI